VEEIWNAIAKSFDSTRKEPWEECLNFIEKIRGRAIDIGCGNGRHLFPLAEKAELAVGLDFSIEMLKICKEKLRNICNVLLVCGNACRLPFKDNSFDYAIFIAALHNIRGRGNRIKALVELKRILKPNGTALISVWAKWQDKWRWYFIKKLFSFKGEHGDIYIPWKKDGINVERFYHLYSKKEFKKDLIKAGLKIEKLWSVKKASKKHPDNHFAIVKAEK